MRSEALAAALEHEHVRVAVHHETREAVGVARDRSRHAPARLEEAQRPCALRTATLHRARTRRLAIGLLRPTRSPCARRDLRVPS